MQNNDLSVIHEDLTHISEQISSLQRAFDVLITLMRKYEIAVLDEKEEVQTQPQFQMA